MGEKDLENSFKYLEKTIMEYKGKIFLTLVSLLFIIFLLNSFFVIDSTYLLNNKINELNELNTPVNISLSIINCQGCSNTTSVVQGIKNENVKILKEGSFNSNSNEAKNLISKYNIQKLPSVIIMGDINNSKVKFSNFKLKGDALVLNDVKAPYLDIASNEIKGKVKIIELIDSSCKECISLSSVPLSFAKSGVSISDWKKVEYNSAEGKKLISEFGVKEIPTILISTDIDYYASIKKSLDQLGLSEKQGFYVLHAVQPPYMNLSENKIVGLVNLIMLNDSSCPECYNVNVNKQILQRLGIFIKSENTYDVSSPEGKALISKYNIQKVPIILLSPEAKVYGPFVNAWKPVGTVESDGWFVMRKPEDLGTVKDIVNDTIIRAGR